MAHLECGAPLLVLKKKLKKKLSVVAHRGCGAPLLVKTSNDALSPGAPLLSLGRVWGQDKTSNGAPHTRCAISNMATNGAPISGASLLYNSGAPHTWCAISVHISYSHFSSSAMRRCYIH